MTSTEAMQFEVGQTYPADDVYLRGAERCGQYTASSNYVCTVQRGHNGPHVAGTSYGEVVHVWPVVDDLAAFRQQVRDLAKTICEGRGYGDWPRWNATMVKLGLEPFVQRTVKVVVPVTRVVADLGERYDEDGARVWLESRRGSLGNYLRVEDDAIAAAEAQIEVEASTPGVEGVYQLANADTDDLDTYKALVREVAIEMGSENSWCDDGVNGVLDELGLDRIQRLQDYSVEVYVRATQTVYITVEATDPDAARDQVETSMVRDRIDRSDWSFDYDDWEIEGVTED